MKNSFKLSIFLLFITCYQVFAQTHVLNAKIQQIVASKHAKVGIAIKGPGIKDTLFINGDQHFPLQSVFKFHVALAILSQVDQGKFSMSQKINITKKDLLPDLYSPIRDRYPNGVNLPLSEILAYTVSQSDNIGCDILLRMIGGPEFVEKYCNSIGIQDVSIKINEEEQQSNWNAQFKNWTTPKAANEILELFYMNKNNLLSKKSYQFIWKVMRETKTGEGRLRGQLPTKTIVAHKTGSSGTNKQGITAAVNDIGVVFLPAGAHYFISVFVTESTENAATNEKIIADINKAAWDYFNGSNSF
ncbi:beta-lactamase class A/beta-lactamase class A VEB [Pedobacter terrae]|uniref:Beta-lactamase n=1 Tax=Pedobacter terrae TaxID=405671 RepID=A0A1G7PYT8_9SPHI|nr:class A beta-lactamase, subclass A2 [Pedobacter terrae]SDF91435.1 beta-lactamase class A/beta-lactamase class A VEB [Pedobacter terrae]